MAFDLVIGECLNCRQCLEITVLVNGLNGLRDLFQMKVWSLVPVDLCLTVTLINTQLSHLLCHWPATLQWNTWFWLILTLLNAMSWATNMSEQADDEGCSWTVALFSCSLTVCVCDCLFSVPRLTKLQKHRCNWKDGRTVDLKLLILVLPLF